MRKENFLIAKPEKALLDELYYMAKKLRHIHIQDLNLDLIDQKKFEQFYQMYKFIPLQKLVKRLKLC